MATLAAPLWGAMMSLFWTTQAGMTDGWGDDTLAARRLVASLNVDWGLPGPPGGNSFRYWSRPDTGDTRYCDNQLRPQLGGIDADGGRALVRLYSAMVRNEQALDRLMAGEAAGAAFLSLPRPVLGALSKCVEASVLAVACAAWARHRLDVDKPVKAKVSALLLANAREADDQACLLLGMAKELTRRPDRDAITH